MQFIANGPNIPEDLLQAHEEGRVVFFCGAGISMPAGLPGFRGLVDEIFTNSNATKNALEDQLYKDEKYDAVLAHYERRLPKNSLEMREAIRQILSPKKLAKNALNTHAALIELSRNSEKQLKLITTNFDLLFEMAAKKLKYKIRFNSAPYLPIPKPNRWDGLVYLHGRLPDSKDNSALKDLVITSGDFGLAYINEGWAARFVSELFRRYEVCFVGYSVDDPIMRYMMDSLSSDNAKGEKTQKVWAFASFTQANFEQEQAKWEAKFVTPILYEVPPGSHEHRALHNTLLTWSEQFRDGTSGKEKIISRYAHSQISASTVQDNFTYRLLWAISDSSGLPAKHFAEINPAPSLDWFFKVFTQDRFQYKDLIRFGIAPNIEPDEKLKFSLVSRPTPYVLSKWMTLLFDHNNNPGWDKVMYQLARWLLRHLNDPALLLWISQSGGQINSAWQVMIEDELSAQQAYDKAKLDETKKNSPMAIVDSNMRVLWSILLEGYMTPFDLTSDPYSFFRKVKAHGLSPSLLRQLQERLSPKIKIKPSYIFDNKLNMFNADSENQLSYELVLSELNIKEAIKVEGAINILTDLKLIHLYQDLLLEAMNLASRVNLAGADSDNSYWHLPSIEPHWQNRGFHDWTLLIELLRDSWLILLKENIKQAKKIVLTWFKLPYPVFKRLALFAASQNLLIEPKVWVSWLLKNKAECLWSPCTKREVMRLLITQGSNLIPTTQSQLENVILKGATKSRKESAISDEDWIRARDYEIWLRLSKLELSQLTLGNNASSRLRQLTNQYPKWKLRENQSDEFSVWHSGTGDPDFEEFREFNYAPTEINHLMSWLMSRLDKFNPWETNDWRQRCRSDPRNCAQALNELVDKNEWPKRAWQEAFQVWEDAENIGDSWVQVHQTLLSMPDSIVNSMPHELTRWVKKAASQKVGGKQVAEERTILLVIKHFLQVDIEDNVVQSSMGDKQLHQPFHQAINHPIGHIAETLIILLFNRQPNDNDGIPGQLIDLFSSLCNSDIPIYRHARIWFCSQLVALYRVDPSWTKLHLIPLFDWNNKEGATIAWEGFLRAQRLYLPLMIELKKDFLMVAKNFDAIQEFPQSYAALLTHMALESTDGFSIEELRSAMHSLPQTGFELCFESLVQITSSEESENNQNYWENRILPFWKNYWPRDKNYLTPKLSQLLAKLCVESGKQFPMAYQLVNGWLKPVENPGYIVHKLNKNELCKRHPEIALIFLNAVIPEQTWPISILRNCLQTVKHEEPELAKSSEYLRLATLVKTWGFTIE